MAAHALLTPGALATAPLASRSPARRSRARSLVTPRCASNDAAPARVWHCPPPKKERVASQAASTLSKLPPHTLDLGGLDPSTQSPQNQQAYLGSLAERFLPVDLSYRGVRVLNVDPPIFAIPDFVTPGEADALAALAKGGKKLVRNVKSVEIGEKLPAPMGDGMPALVQRLGELVDDCKRFVRCDGAWLDGSPLNNWGMTGGFANKPPPGAFAFETPVLCVTGKGKITDELPDAFDREGANDAGYQRRALIRVALTDPPVDPAVGAEAEEGQSAPEIDRDCFGIKYTICDLALSPRKGTAIVTFPAFADGMPDERALCAAQAREGEAAAWLDFPISVGLDEGGIAKPVSMSDVTVEKVGEEGNIGEAARDKNRQEWRANISGGGGGEDAGATEEAKKKLEELKDAGL
jgi:hypothetical protein